MAFGDLVLQKEFERSIASELGHGFTINNDTAIFTSPHAGIETAMKIQLTDFAHAGNIMVGQQINSIQYDSVTDTYWCVSNNYEEDKSLDPAIYTKAVFNINEAGTVNVKFNPLSIIPNTDWPLDLSYNWQNARISCVSLSLDEKNVLVSLKDSNRLFSFDLNGLYVDFKDLSVTEQILGITKSKENYFISHYNYGNFADDLTIIKTDENLAILESFSHNAELDGGYGFPSDIEYDEIQFAPVNVVYVKYHGNENPETNRLLAFEVSSQDKSCNQPPTIIANDKIIEIDGVFDALKDVKAFDCSGIAIPLTIDNITENTVNPSVAGVYNVTYQVASAINLEIATKTISVTVKSVSARFRAISDIAESVALEETAIARILNAEGAKIQKAIALNSTAEELIKINKSVESMVKEISYLEMILKSKIGLFEDCLCQPID